MSIVRANSWQRTDGNLVGTVLQVKQTLYTTTTSQSVSANTLTNITGITATITPYSTSSKILIFTRWFGEWSGSGPHDHIYYIARNGTRINIQQSTGSRMTGLATVSTNYQTSGDWNNDSTPETLSIFTMDSPASTSALTYTLGCLYGNAGTLYTNTTVATNDSTNYERGSSEIILMEIAT